MPTSAPPEFVLVGEGGTESPPLERGGALGSYKDMVTVDLVRGAFAVSKSVPLGKVIRIRVYQTIPSAGVAQFEFVRRERATLRVLNRRKQR